MLTELQGNVWEAEVPALVDQPEAGMHLLVLSPMASPGPIRIRVNGSEPFPIWKTPGILLDGAEIPEGAALSIVLDGTAFHLLNGSTYMKRPCMPGTVQVTEHYCIEASKRSAADLFQAFSSCNASGMRLCSWGEFILACQRAGEIGMLNPTSSWEWTGDASNENNCARVVGVGSCLSAGNSFASGSTPRNFRCCHSR